MNQARPPREDSINLSRTHAHAALFRAVDATRMLGAASLLAVAPRWLARQSYLVLVRELGSPIPRMPRPQSMSWTALTPAELPLVRAINPALSEAESLRRLDAGQECHLFWLAGAPVYYRWDTTRPAYLPYLSTTLRPMHGDLFTVEAFTHPAFRDRGIHSFATSLVLRRAGRNGLKRSVTMVAWWNRPGLRVAHEKSERSIAGIIGRWGLGAWRHHYASGAVCVDQGEIVVLPTRGYDQVAGGAEHLLSPIPAAGQPSP